MIDSRQLHSRWRPNRANALHSRPNLQLYDKPEYEKMNSKLEKFKLSEMVTERSEQLQNVLTDFSKNLRE